MIVFLQIIIGCLLLQYLFALWNTAQLPKLGISKSKHITKGSKISSTEECNRCVSVLIPARDEADNIGDCLASVLACRITGWDLEIIVLDDRSSDETGRIARATGDERVKVMAGRELPIGWLGKSYACNQLMKAASGEWLLYLDADIRLKPEALENALAMADAQEEGLITGFAYQQTGTWLEKLVVPLMTFTIICHLPILLVRTSRDPRFVAAHGGFMLVHRNSYIRCGGHAAIRSDLVDDMALARAVKKAGDQVTLADITDYAEMRMYHNASEVWNGYRKNIYAGLGRRSVILLGMLSLYTLLYVFPLAAFIFFSVTGQAAEASWALSASLLGIAIKRISDAFARQSVWLCLLISVSILCLAVIAISSWWGSRSGQGYEWKGRRYL